MSGHCCHCAKDCGARIGMGNFIHNNFRSGASWIDGHCPACAEAERIADAITADADAYWNRANPDKGRGYMQGMDRARRIARGEA